MKKISFTVPVQHCEEVKAAMYEAGAGRYENYEMQSWQVLGQAEFKPLAGASPTIGRVGELEKVQEYKVEMFCVDTFVDLAIKALLKTHPYEGPQYEVYTIENQLCINRTKI